MRVSKQQSADNRARILSETARLIRESGIAGVGVDALTRAAGLTHGGLYSQFGSKEALVTEALEQALAASGEKTQKTLAEGGTLATLVQRYLSARHRDEPGSGCAVAAIGPEAARHSPGIRRTYTTGVERFAGRMAPLMPQDAGQAPEDAALATMATMVGALTLARAVDDPDLSDRILAAAIGRLLPAD